jgi:hypothetical protein
LEGARKRRGKVELMEAATESPTPVSLKEFIERAAAGRGDGKKD